LQAHTQACAHTHTHTLTHTRAHTLKGTTPVVKFTRTEKFCRELGCHQSRACIHQMKSHVTNPVCFIVSLLFVWSHKTCVKQTHKTCVKQTQALWSSWWTSRTATISWRSTHVFRCGWYPCVCECMCVFEWVFVSVCVCECVCVMKHKYYYFLKVNPRVQVWLVPLRVFVFVSMPVRA